jgi:hypothetical protein
MLFFTLTYDLGTDLEHHGQFNLMFYIIIWFPLLFGYPIYRLIKIVKRVVGNKKK